MRCKVGEDWRIRVGPFRLIIQLHNYQSSDKGFFNSFEWLFDDWKCYIACKEAMRSPHKVSGLVDRTVINSTIGGE